MNILAHTHTLTYNTHTHRNAHMGSETEGTIQRVAEHE